MRVNVSVQVVSPRILAAVGRRVAPGGVGAAWRPALDLVWAFLRTQPDPLTISGHNVFLYEHPAHRGDPMDAFFGVEVVREFAPTGEVRPVKTPAGEVAVATHTGPYDRLGRTHEAIQAFVAAQDRVVGDKSWEIYGDWTENPAKLETTVMYLLR